MQSLIHNLIRVCRAVSDSPAHPDYPSRCSCGDSPTLSPQFMACHGPKWLASGRNWRFCVRNWPAHGLAHGLAGTKTGHAGHAAGLPLPAGRGWGEGAQACRICPQPRIHFQLPSPSTPAFAGAGSDLLPTGEKELMQAMPLHPRPSASSGCGGGLFCAFSEKNAPDAAHHADGPLPSRAGRITSPVRSEGRRGLREGSFASCAAALDALYS